MIILAAILHLGLPSSLPIITVILFVSVNFVAASRGQGELRLEDANIRH